MRALSEGHGSHPPLEDSKKERSTSSPTAMMRPRAPFVMLQRSVRRLLDALEFQVWYEWTLGRADGGL